MSHDDIEKIKSRLGIKEVVGGYIKLEKAGKNYKGKCPFHNEKTPSFVVSPDRDSYFCFGCGEKGDIFSFVQKFENVDFLTSLHLLADRAGVQLQKHSGKEESRLKRMKEILNLSAVFFKNNLLKNQKVLDYLCARGLDKKTIKDWNIGFADEEWHKVLDFLLSKKYSKEEIRSTGMIKKSDRGNYYDTFRDRIMFPISNSVGQVVAFSGRIFASKDEPAKYLNTPETELFKKSEVLYGFSDAKSIIRKNNFTILVEGQIDVLMCHQSGYKNTVASSGTALTEHQLGMIKRISPQLVIAYDSDSAGFKASQKAWQMALGLGMDVKIAPIPEGKDPADILQGGKEGWKKIIKKSKHIIEVLIEKIKAETNDPRKIGNAINVEIIPYLGMIQSKIDQAHFVKLVAQEFSISEEAIYSNLLEFTQKMESKRVTNTVQTLERRQDKLTIEKRIFGIISWQKCEENKQIDVENLESKFKEIVGDYYEKIISNISESIEETVFHLEDDYADENLLGKDIEELLVNLKDKYIKIKIAGLNNELRVAEKNGNDELGNDLLKKISKLQKQSKK